MLESIPADRREIARSALSSTFGTSPLTALQPITSGASGALIYRIEVGGRPYLLRLEGLVRDHVRDPHRTYRCMQIAADAGIAPALRHADPAAGAAIMDFVGDLPLADYPGGLAARARDLGALVARLQATPAFPAVAPYPAVIAGMLDRLVASGRYAPGLLDAHREGFERIRAGYRWDEKVLVSSHNDIHPGNILFDGQRLWLIDWETAYRSDPLVDIAVMTLYLVTTPETRDVLFAAWLGRAPDRRLMARLVLMRQLVRLFYACANGLFVAAAGGYPPETDLVALTPAEFVAGIAAGRLVQGTVEAQRVGSKVALRTFMEGLASSEFELALAVARQG
jgi:aminoglycoside phosphotransferase (APT) family kinase protein